MSVYVIDLETTANGGPDGGSPEAHWRNNKILFGGVWTDHCEFVATHKPASLGKFLDTIQPGDLIVGHNLKFDLKYLVRDYPSIEWHKLKYICTMTAHYENTGQLDKFIKLEELAEKLDIPTKKTMDLGAWLEAGNKMEDIPEKDLRDYLEVDVDITTEILRNLKTRNYHNYLLPLAVMELNGLPLDIPKTQELAGELWNKLDESYGHLAKTCLGHLEWEDGTPLTKEELTKRVKLAAPRTVSYLLTGQPEKGLTTGRKLNIKQKRSISIDWLALDGMEPSHLGYPMDEHNLSAMRKQCAIEGGFYTTYIDAVLETKLNSKLLSTYVNPFLEQGSIQGTIHPKLNTTSTATGRLSSSKPNGQNLPEEARNLIKSKHGNIYEIDFSQLEVVALAHITNDRQLVADLKDGVDVHYETGKDVFGWKIPADMDEKDRKAVKGVVFGTIYGGGPVTLSKQSGVPENTVRDIIKAFYTRYPRVPEWQGEWIAAIERSKEPYSATTKGMQYSSTVECEGMLFTYVQSESPDWLRSRKGPYSFSPTQAKNYPIQGFAGKKVVMTFIELLYKELVKYSDTDLIMTVHDSVVVDSYLEPATVETLANAVAQDTAKKLGLEVPLNVNVKYGEYWK